MELAFCYNSNWNQKVETKILNTNFGFLGKQIELFLNK
jgi:hypothetical protein